MPSHFVQPGRLRQTLYLQAQTTSYGNPGTWANVTTTPGIRCSMTHMSASEPASISGERGENRIDLEMRYRSDITYAHRFTDGANRFFDIVGIIDVNEMRHKLLVTVVERTVTNG